MTEPFSVLQDRILWFDGDVTVTNSSVSDYIHYPTPRLHVEVIDESVEQFNKFNATPITIKRELKKFDSSWTIPKYYLSLDLDKIIIEKFLNSEESKIQKYEKLNRIEQELRLIHNQQLDDVFKCILYCMDQFKENNITYGVGRGSSVSSYILYILDVHCVDSFKYNLDYYDFFDTP